MGLFLSIINLGLWISLIHRNSLNSSQKGANGAELISTPLLFK